MTLKNRWIGFAVFATAATLALGPADEARGEMLEYTRGHGDIGVALQGNTMFLHYHFGSNVVLGGVSPPPRDEYDPSEVITRVAGPTVARPAGANWDFVGVPAGSPLWFLPQISDVNKPFLGIATEDLDAADWTTSITWNLVSATGPGFFSLWQNDVFGNPGPKLTSADGISANDMFTQGIGAHDHYVFGFTAPGTYQIRLRVAGTHRTLGALADVETFHFIVGSAPIPEPSSAALILIGLVAIPATRRHKPRSDK